MKKDELNITKIKADCRKRLQLLCSHQFMMHRNENDIADTFIFVGNQVTCKVCGARFFNPDAKSKEDIEKSVSEVVDILETMKFMDKNYKEHIEYYNIAQMLKRLPEIYTLVESEFNNKHPFTDPTLNIDELLNRFFKEEKPNVVFNQSADQIFNVDHVDSIDDLDEMDNWLKGEEV